VTGNERTNLFQRWTAKRRAKHESPIPADLMADLKRKGWRLVAQSKQQKAAES